MLNITEGKISRAKKVVIYGAEGIGKSTLAAQFPQPLFIDTEGGTAQLDVRRVQAPASWPELLAIIEEVAKTPGICKTLVLDTADWAEMACVKYLCEKYKVTGLESFGYGKGYTFVAEETARLLSMCDRVIEAGINMVILAHAKMRKQELPDEQGAFDRWEMKLSKQAAPLFKEWPDLLLFLNYKTLVVTSETSSKKATGGKRVMYTSHSPVWDAKNRFGLPDELDLGFDGIAHLFEEAKVTAQTEPLQEKLAAMLAQADVSAQEVQKVVAERTGGKYRADIPVTEYPDKFLSSWLFPHWDKIVSIITSNPDRLPL